MRFESPVIGRREEHVAHALPDAASVPHGIAAAAA